MQQQETIITSDDKKLHFAHNIPECWRVPTKTKLNQLKLLSLDDLRKKYARERKVDLRLTHDVSQLKAKELKKFDPKIFNVTTNTSLGDDITPFKVNTPFRDNTNTITSSPVRHSPVGHSPAVTTSSIKIPTTPFSIETMNSTTITTPVGLLTTPASSLSSSFNFSLATPRVDLSTTTTPRFYTDEKLLREQMD